MRLALRLARRGYGLTSPNPMVGAVLVRRGEIIGRGWHHRAGEPHAEIEALNDAQHLGHTANGATLYVTLEPCCTHGRTPPCTDAILAAGIRKVVVGATDPNPRHSGRGFRVLSRHDVAVARALEEECGRLNEAFNHWIVQQTPFVTVKAAMTLDGKIATASGESKWITGPRARAFGMKLRQGADAILVGINTILADDPALTIRGCGKAWAEKKLRRIVLDSEARTPLTAQVVSDRDAGLTTIIVGGKAPKSAVAALAKKVQVVQAPAAARHPMLFLPRPEAARMQAASPARGSARRHSLGIDIEWVLRRLGAEKVTSLLVEGGGQVNASFLLPGLANRVAFFYAPRILGGRDARHAVGGQGARTLDEMIQLEDVKWRRLGPDWLLTARCAPPRQKRSLQK